ncbi:MAG: hypothetical protein IE917_10845 [Betaproteobacteria bacterium]|nr:hypothetical protein [Betaproteobacteria bacterium]
MTIRFVKYWNGYSPDAIIHNLGSTEEARLVSLGYAMTDLDGENDGVLEDAKLKISLSGEISIIDPRDGSLLGLTPASYTWAGKPAASASNAGQTIRITDVGHSASGSLFQSDGTIWRPVNGIVLIGAGAGSIAAPIATVTGVVNGAFTLPLGNPTMPADFLPVGAIVKVSAIFHRRGANGTGTVWARLGNNGNSTDSGVNGAATTATDGKDTFIDAHAMIASATTFAAQTWLAPQSTGAGTIVDRTSNAAIASAMIASFDVAGANALDAFDLIMYKVTAEF